MTQPIEWREEAIARHHDRSSFDCGVPELNEYLARYARQNHDAGGAKTFVAVTHSVPRTVFGYYSISPGSIEFGRVPRKFAQRLGRYEVPVFRLARLAVALALQRRGFGAELLLAAGERALAVAAEVGGVALAIDAKNHAAAEWYERFGALRLLDDPLKLMLPLDTIAGALAVSGRVRRDGE